ncbi:MAG: peptidoglycan DD-metalloendopeptidase family protein [bacterium]|nr:peptidoglycan DD-metalloendopeptidase family protein [bacterium]
MKPLLFLLLVTLSDIEEGKKNLLSISEELKKTTGALKKAEEEKSNLTKQIEASILKEKKDEKKLAEVETRLKETGKNLKKTKDKIASISEELEEEKDRLSFFVKKAYQSTPPNNISYLLLGEKDQRSSLLLLIDKNAGRIEKKETEKERIFIEKNKLENFYDYSKKSKENVSLNIKMEKEKRTVIAKNLEREEKETERHKAKIAALKKEQKKLEGLIADLTAKRKPAREQGEAYKLKGGLVWPISGGRITREFGRYTHPETNAVMINKGIDISASQGTEVRSIGTGEVVYADWFVGYGKLIMIDHGSGLYSLYAYLNKISVKQGATVAAGSAIGTVGSTGSVETPTLHFEIRVNGQPQDPLDWVK